MIVFKPRKVVVITITVLFVIGLAFPFLIYNQSGSLRTREIVGIIVISSILSYAGFRGLLALKTIGFDQDYWTISYHLFPARKRAFHIGEIAALQRLDYVTYKTKLPVTTFIIELKDSCKIRISSNEITDFEQLEGIFDKREYQSLINTENK